MHASLRLQPNIVIIGACLLVAVGTAMRPGPFPVLAWAVAVGFGVVVGGLQSRSMRMVPEKFLGAQSSVEVRKALMSTRPGRLTVLGQWIVLPLLLVTGWWGGNVVAGALGGYALFMAVRDIVSLRTIVWLASLPRPTDT